MGIDGEQCPASGTITIKQYNDAFTSPTLDVLPIAPDVLPIPILEMDSCFDNPFFWTFHFDHSRCVPFPTSSPTPAAFHRTSRAAAV